MSREYKFPTWLTSEEREKVLYILRSNTSDCIKLAVQLVVGKDAYCYKTFDGFCRSKFMIGFAEGLEYAKSEDISENKDLKDLKEWNGKLGKSFTVKLGDKIQKEASAGKRN